MLIVLFFRSNAQHLDLALELQNAFFTEGAYSLHSAHNMGLALQHHLHPLLPGLVAPGVPHLPGQPLLVQPAGASNYVPFSYNYHHGCHVGLLQLAVDHRVLLVLVSWVSAGREWSQS